MSRRLLKYFSNDDNILLKLKWPVDENESKGVLDYINTELCKYSMIKTDKYII